MKIPSFWQLPEAITSRIGEDVGRQRMMSHEGHLLLILHRLPGPDASAREGVLFWKNPEGQWHSTERGGGWAELKKHVQTYDDAIDELDAMLGKASLATEYFDILNRVTPICRAATNLHSVLQSLREVSGNDKRMITLRDQAYEAQRNAELLKEDTKNGLDYEIARKAEEQTRQSESASKAAHRLNILAAIFLPVTAVATVLGAEVPTGLDNLHPGAFWGLMAASILVGVGLMISLSRK